MIWLGPLVFVYVIISTMFWTGVVLWERDNPYAPKNPLVRWCFILIRWTIPIYYLYCKLILTEEEKHD